jgi:hypothetical protein
MRRLFFGICLISTMFIPTTAQETMNTTGQSANEPSPTLSAEIWERLGTDYFTDDIEVIRMNIDAESAMNAIDPELEGCVGFVTADASYRIHWDRATLEEDLPLRIFATSSDDLVLLIHEPDDDWHCADDYGNTEHPMIEISSLRAGDYRIWVGSKTDTSLITPRLYISIGSHTPERPPASCCADLSFSNPADTYTEATITYFEVNTGSLETSEEGITISTDIIFRAETGADFLTELIVYDMRGNEIILEDIHNRDELCANRQRLCDAESLRRDSRRRDYSTTGPVLFSVQSLDYEQLGSSYYLEVAITLLNDDGTEGQIVDIVVIGRD